MRVCLIGNQNSGKTTLFNSLTGKNQKIGNWPGVTIDKKEGNIKTTASSIVDLPGIYSLSPYSSEENISRNFLLNESPDLIINVIDATNFERSLYLTSQLLELNIPLVICINMLDVLEKHNYKFDHKKLEALLNVKVFMLSALKKKGLENLIEYVKHLEQNLSMVKPLYHFFEFSPRVEMGLKKIVSLLNIRENSRFLAIKLLEEDEKLQSYVNKEIKNEVQNVKNIEADIEMHIASKRYERIEDIKKEVILFELKTQKNDKIDSIFLNKYVGIPIFIVIMFSIYFLSVGVIGSATTGLVESAFEWLIDKTTLGLESLKASEWVISLTNEGILSGIGAVLGFLPQIFILFILINILEATGYMSRVTLLFDRLFHKIGLSGKSLIPFIVGAGCSVPGIMSTRILENEEERKMSVLLTPFMPCSAKLPIIALFAGALFPNSHGFVSATLYFLAILVIIFSALLLKKFFYKSHQNLFMSELPNYKMPSFKYVFRDSFEKVFEFLKRAGTIIFTLSIIVWFLASFNFRFEYGVDINESILAGIGRAFSFLLYPIIGTNSWAATVSFLQGLVAKEAVVTSMSVLNNVADNLNGTINPDILLGGSGLFSFFTPLSAYSFMVFNLFSAPCIGAMAAMKKEFKSKKLMLYGILFQTGLAYVLASLIFLIGSLLQVIF